MSTVEIDSIFGNSHKKPHLRISCKSYCYYDILIMVTLAISKHSHERESHMPSNKTAHTHQCHGKIWLGPTLTVNCYIWAMEGQLSMCANCKRPFCTMHIYFNSFLDKWLCKACGILCEMGG